MTQCANREEQAHSGINWIAHIPSGWSITRIKTVSALRNVRRNEISPEETYVGLEDVESGSGLYCPSEGSARKIDNSTVSMFKNGDVLYGKLRPYLKKSFVAERDGVCSTEFLVLDVATKILVKPQWLHLWLLTDEVTQRIEAGCDGAKMPRASWDHVASIPIPFPSISEQEKILNEFYRKASRIDSLIAKKTRFMELLKEKRQTVITKAVTTGLDDSVEMKDSGVAWIGEVPTHWWPAKLRYISKFSGGGTPSREEASYWNGFIPWVSPKDMKTEKISDTQERITETGLQNSPTSIISAGSVLIVVRSGILRHTIPAAINEIEVALNQDMKAIELDKNMCMPEFLLRWIQGLNKSLLLEWSKMGATVESIEHDFLARTLVPLPPLYEQSEIILFLNNQLKRIDNLIKKTERSIELLKEKRSALITAAVTGKIDVREAA